MCIFNDNGICVYLSEGVCQNKHFEKPTRSEFQAQMREALRMAKERHRARSRKNKGQQATGNGAMIQERNLWNDERPQEGNNSTDEEYTNTV